MTEDEEGRLAEMMGELESLAVTLNAPKLSRASSFIFEVIERDHGLQSDEESEISEHRMVLRDLRERHFT